MLKLGGESRKDSTKESNNSQRASVLTRGLNPGRWQCDANPRLRKSRRRRRSGAESRWKTRRDKRARAGISGHGCGQAQAAAIKAVEGG